MILGVDTGGTFTDFVLYVQNDQHGHFRTHKVLSTPDSPEHAILQGIQEMGLEHYLSSGALRIIHGTTVATNAALEGKGVKTAFITNRGFKDLLTIGRQTRPKLYQLETPPITPPVPSEYCLEIGGRIDASGACLETLASTDLKKLLAQLQSLKPDAIAINLLFSFLDEQHEKTIETFLKKFLHQDTFISRSSDVLPEYKEYERGIATWLNACLGPLVQQYLLKLQSSIKPCPLSIMQSTGGTIDAKQAAQKAVNLLFSGPAGGLAAANFLSRTIQETKLMTFDMGGTSTDVALLDDGIGLTNEGRIGPYPVAVPMIDMHTIGAGGGSIAFVDDGGLLQVGPRSAGANPGPACYGKGGKFATVTDANLLLGRLLPDTVMGGQITLNIDDANKVIKPIAEKLKLTSIEVAKGIIQLSNEHMARALRVISVERGHDPAKFRLCCFGGAGGLHVCELADALLMRKALVPINSGVFSAMGMFLAPPETQISKTHFHLLSDLNNKEIESLKLQLEIEAKAQLIEDLTDSKDLSTRTSVDLRYRGQSATLNIPWKNLKLTAREFIHHHEKRYGHSLSVPIEMVNIRVSVNSSPLPVALAKLTRTELAQPYCTTQLSQYQTLVPVYCRDLLCPKQEISGPALITERNATTMVSSSWLARSDIFGNLMLEKKI